MRVYFGKYYQSAYFSCVAVLLALLCSGLVGMDAGEVTDIRRLFIFMAQQYGSNATLHPRWQSKAIILGRDYH